MDRNKKKLFQLVFVDLFSIIFPALLTVSFYGYVLEEIGVDHAENVRSYDKCFVMIVGDTEFQSRRDTYVNVKGEAADQDAYVELKGTNQSSAYSIADFVNMSIAAKVDGILLEYTVEEALEEKVDKATNQDISAVTILDDALRTERRSYVGISPYQLGQGYVSQIWKIFPQSRGSLRATVLLHDDTIDSNQSRIPYQINNRIVTSEKTAGRAEVEEIRISSERTFEFEETAWNLFQNQQGVSDITVCTDEVDTEAVYQAAIDYSRMGKIQVTGYYKPATILEAVRRGTMAMFFCIDTEQTGRDSTQTVMECIRGRRTSSFCSVDLQFVTNENASCSVDMDQQGDIYGKTLGAVLGKSSYNSQIIFGDRIDSCCVACRQLADLCPDQ